jgi:lipoprotein-releasing system permease protein
VVNVITFIAVFGILVSSAALVVVLGVFNGFNDLIRELYDGFDPDLQIVAARGRYLPSSADSFLAKIKNHPGVASVSMVVAGKAVLEYNQRQAIVLLKGVDAHYPAINHIHRYLTHGKYVIANEDNNYRTIVAGQGVLAQIEGAINDLENQMELYTVSDRTSLTAADPARALNRVYVMAAGTFLVQQKEYDDQFVYCDLTLAQELFETGGRLTAWELALKPGWASERVKVDLATLLGSEYRVKNWYELHETLYKVMQNEKAVGYLIISFMLLLSSFNVAACLTLIILEKKADIALFLSMGATPLQVYRIFLLEGLLISFLGGGMGLIVGFGLCTFQEYTHFFKLGNSDSLIINYWPISQYFSDYVVVLGTVFILALAAAWYPAWKAARSGLADTIRQG